MTGSTLSVEQQLKELGRSVDDLSDRVSQLEKSQQPGHPSGDRADSEFEGGSSVSTTPKWAQSGTYATLGGRTCVVLGGAFFLRMLTDSEALVPDLGIVLGLFYAVLWIAFADRAAARGRNLSSTIHGLTAAVIAFPIIWEATTSFGIFSPTTSAIVLLAFTTLELAVAWRGTRRLLAWVTVSFSLAIGIGLLFITRAMVPFSAQMLMTAGAALWLGYRHHWVALPVLGALAVDVVVLVLTLASVYENPEWLFPGQVLFAQLGLLVVFLGLFSVRHILLRAEVSLFDLVQMVMVVLIGFEGAAHVGTHPNMMLYAGVASFIAAVCSYVVGFRVFANRSDGGLSYLTYTIIGSIALMEGCRFILPSSVAPLALVALGVIAAWLGRRTATVVFRAHGALFVLAAVLSGWAGPVVDSFVGGSTDVWRPFEPITWLSLALTTATYVVLFRMRPINVRLWLIRLPELVVHFVAVVGVCGVVVSFLAGPVSKMGTLEVDAGALAVLRTASLALACAILVFGARFSGRSEFRRLAWVFVILSAIKLIVEDIPHGRPGTLFISLVLFGTALILAAQRGRREIRESD